MYRLIYTQFRWCALFIPLPYVNIFLMFIFVLGFFKKNSYLFLCAVGI